MSVDKLSEESIEKKDWDISVCGLNCARCTTAVRGDCKGCRGPLNQCWSDACEFRPCAEIKGHQYCFQCDDFPCGKLLEFASDGYDHHRITVENMKRMREIGLEAWIAEQPKVMYCPGWLI